MRVVVEKLNKYKSSKTKNLAQRDMNVILYASLKVTKNMEN